jgi:hypothetical protein
MLWHCGMPRQFPMFGVRVPEQLSNWCTNSAELFISQLWTTKYCSHWEMPILLAIGQHRVGLRDAQELFNKWCGAAQNNLQSKAKCDLCWQPDILQENEVIKKIGRLLYTQKLFLKCPFWKRCHWTSGYSWRKALFLSITMGGFGVDRFYLGHWKSAIGKFVV